MEYSKHTASYWCEDSEHKNGHQVYNTKGCEHYAGSPIEAQDQSLAVNKAIAYKLDEILKKLERK